MSTNLLKKMLAECDRTENEQGRLLVEKFMTDDVKIEDIIDLEELKKYIKYNFGSKCSVYVWDCPICRSWKIYSELEAYLDYIDMLDSKVNKKDE